MMKVLKNIRLMILLFLVLISVSLISTRILIKRSAVVVSFVEDDSPCKNIRVGDVLNQMGRFVISNKNDFDAAVSEVKSGQYITMVINNGPGGCVANKNAYLGLRIREVGGVSMPFDLDLVESKVLVFKPSDELNMDGVEKTVEILEDRIKVFKILGMRIYTDGKKIKIASLEEERIGSFTVIGDFEGKLSAPVEIKDGKGSIPIGDDSYEIKYVGGKVEYDNSLYDVGDGFMINGIEFDIINITNGSVQIEALIFNNKDISETLPSYSFARYDQASGLYDFNVFVEMSNDASDRFANLTTRMKTEFVGTESVVVGKLIYYLDGEVISRLNIPFQMAGRRFQQNIFGINGYRNSLADAEFEKTRILAILENDKLPSKLNMVDIERLEGKYKNIVPAISLVFGAIVTLSVFIYFVLNKNSGLVPIALGILVAEFISIFGIILLINRTKILWIIDIYTIIGLFAFGFMSMIEFILGYEKEVKKRRLTVTSRGINFHLILVAVVSLLAFCLLFTELKGLGLVLLVGVVLKILITDDLFRKYLKLKSM